MRKPSRSTRVRHGISLAAGLGLVALSLLIDTAAAQEASHADRVKTTIVELLAGREFKAESGCDRGEPCGTLLARLRAGEFAVIEPTETSDRPDMPTYLQARKKCTGLDPVSIVLSHHTFKATRNFAMYRLAAPRWARTGEEVLIFRAQDYVITRGERHGTAEDEATAPLPGSFVAFGQRNCRFLSTAPAETGERFAMHNVIEANDHASELVKIGERYFVLNLVPVAGPRQPKATWWYTLGLWDLGLSTAGDLRKQHHVYSFGYKPAIGAGAARDEIAAFFPG